MASCFPCCRSKKPVMTIKKAESSLHFTVKIDDIMARIKAAQDEAREETISSTPFVVKSSLKGSKQTWKFVLGIQINGSTPNGTNSKFIKVYLTSHVDEASAPVRVSMEMAILDRGKKQNQVYKHQSSVFVLNSGQVKAVVSDYVEKDKLSSCLRNETFFFKVSVTVHHNKEKGKGLGFINVPPLGCDLLKTNTQGYITDIKNLPDPGNYSDFVLESSDGEAIPVSKMILAARSPVFATMLSQSESEEVLSGKCKIQDYDAVTLKAFWTFLLGDENPGPMVSAPEDQAGVQFTMDLLALANKYEVKGLFAEAERQLAFVVCQQNAAEMIKLADAVGAAALEAEVLNFLKENVKMGGIDPGTLADLPRDVRVKVFARFGKK